MTPVELVFAVYGLLLGLAVAEVLGGFSRALKLKRGAKAVKIGWLTPLLGLFVMLDLMSFWMVAWAARDQIAANYGTLIAVLAIVGIYYLAATLIFPDDPEDWPDFDDWYDKQNRLVIGGMLTANLLSWIGQIALEVAAPSADAEAMSDTAMLVAAGGTLAIVALLGALLAVKGRKANVAMLAALIAVLVVAGVGGEMV
jgi:hypothetical protein